jgi:hypothetical protein
MKMLDRSLTTTTLEINREELLLIKNVLYESYIELGEWEFTKRIGLAPDHALALLKSINNALKSTI